MDIKIRRITPREAQALSAISRTTFHDTFAHSCTAEDMQYFLDNYFSLEQTQKELNDPRDLYYFAELNGVPVGYLRMMEDYRSFELMEKWKALEIKRIYVLKEYHGKGIAQALMNFAIDFAKQNHYEALFLGVWEHNQRAQKFYGKYGFVDSGYTHPFPIGNTPQTDLWMWKFLNGQPG